MYSYYTASVMQRRSSLSPHAGGVVHNAVRDQRNAVRASITAQPAMVAAEVNMATVTNPKTLNWIWPTTAVDQNGNSVPLALSDIAAVEVQFDGGAVIDVTAVTGASGANASLILASLAAYQALKPGTHTVDIAARTAEGAVGGFTAPVSFLIAVVPAAPTGVAFG